MQRPDSDDEKQNQFDGLYYDPEGKKYFWDQPRMGVNVEVGGVNTNGMSQKHNLHQKHHNKHHKSIPSCNSFEYAEGKCKKESADGKYHDPVVADAIEPNYYHYYDDRYKGIVDNKGLPIS